VHQIRALFVATCAEGGGPRITKVSASNGALACGPSHGLEESGLALVRAFATMGDPVRAAWALERAELPPATRTPARAVEAQGWIAQAAPSASAKQLRAIAAVPLAERGTQPSWGPLAFEPSGKLLVRTTAGLARVDPVAGDETDAPDAAPWKTEVASPDGATRWVDVFAGCDNLALHAAFVAPAGASARDVPLPVAPPVGAHCASGKGEPARAVAIAWGPRGLEAVVAGEPLLFAPDLSRATIAAGPPLDQPAQPGSPRSPNGRVLVLPTSQGILERTSGKTRMLRAKELDGGYGELQGCTVSDDGAAVACVRGGRAFVGVWDAP
jgi:hypothetical protein